MDDKRKITVYINEETYQKMNNYISCNYNTAYGATSNTVDEALNFYLWKPESITPHAIARSQMWQDFQQKLEEVKKEDV